MANIKATDLPAWEKRVQSGVHFMLGNYALVEGAISAGCDFFAGYPITPANEISERMSQRLPEVGGKFVQGEDELCSIYACAGAALAGGKVMTATASAGFNYMQEGLGYCYTVEAPVVIANVQRCRGENYASQADVYQMRYGASGDYEAIVVCPSSVQELYDYTIWAFNLAETYRNPVIVMSETTIALMRERLDIPQAGAIELFNRRYTTLPPQDYQPFAAAPFGCPDAAPLAQGYHTIYSLNPHNEMGSIDWDPDEFERLYRRVCGKIRENSDKICRTERYDLDDAEAAIVAYGAGGGQDGPGERLQAGRFEAVQHLARAGAGAAGAERPGGHHLRRGDEQRQIRPGDRALRGREVRRGQRAQEPGPGPHGPGDLRRRDERSQVRWNKRTD